MASVFIGGSRAVSRLNDQIRKRLDDVQNRECAVLVGDANGADKAVQQYLAKCGYRRVLVYCMRECRNNVGGWDANFHSAGKGAKGFEYYAIKDRAMARDANCGVMLWDGKSRGTLNNVTNLLASQKKVLLYLSPSKTFHKLSDMTELKSLLQASDQKDLQTLARKSGTLVDSLQMHLR
jgi:hypothetical protein